MKAYQRILAILITCVTLLSAIPFTLSATTTEEYYDLIDSRLQAQAEEAAADALDSGRQSSGVVNPGMARIANGTGSYTITAEPSLRVRSTPNTNGAILGSLYPGNVVNVTEISGSWGKISFNGSTGWIHLDYASKNGTNGGGNTTPTPSVGKQYSMSNDGLWMLKQLEGYRQYKYWDYSQWSIGYGSACSADAYPNGITEAEASALLVQRLATYEGYLDKFLSKYGIYVTQPQYDALVSFTYNLGNPWTKWDTFKLKTILINGPANYSANEIRDAFKEFVRAGGQVLSGLVTRRETEAARFLLGTNFDFPFTDVNTGAWYYEAVRTCYRNKYMSGTAANKFSPNAYLTRAMVVNILGNVQGIDKSQFTGSSFKDVPTGQWYSPYVQWACKAGITAGVEDGSIFAPNKNVTRQDMITMLYRLVAYKGLSTSVSSNSAYKNFNDSKYISAYAVKAVNWAVDKNIVNGDDFGYLRAGYTITRAEAAQVVHTYTKNILGK